MKTKFLIFILWAPVACLGAVVNPVNISQSDIQVEAQIKKSCEKYSNVAKEVDCETHLDEVNAANLRGTEEYAAKHYQKLNNEALYVKEQELIRLKKMARAWDIASLDPTDGEITKEKYEIEINWIKQELNHRHYVPPAERKKPEDSPIRIVRP